jgi:hypothetical protein
MGGPRVTSGTESKQDYQTPKSLMEAIKKRFGPISFDLAAHAGNKQHPRYFAPTYFTETFEEMLPLESFQGLPIDASLPSELKPISISFVKQDKKKGIWIYEKKTWNDDPEAYGKDAFAHSWAALSDKFHGEHRSGRGLLYLNCEFNDITPWARRCCEEGEKGANILLLTPMTTANWFRDYMAGKGDCYPLSGRLSFDGKNVFPKDCLITNYSPDCRGDLFLWDWQRDEICHSWGRTTR